jgi:hypothetical protein
MPGITVKPDEKLGKHMRVNFKAEILDIKGNVLYVREYKDVVLGLKDISRTDDPNEAWSWYFINPAHPQLDMEGEYSLRFTMKDLYGEKTATTTIDFKVTTARKV